MSEDLGKRLESDLAEYGVRLPLSTCLNIKDAIAALTQQAQGRLPEGWTLRAHGIDAIAVSKVGEIDGYVHSNSAAFDLLAAFLKSPSPAPVRTGVEECKHVFPPRSGFCDLPVAHCSKCKIHYLDAAKEAASKGIATPAQQAQPEPQGFEHDFEHHKSYGDLAISLSSRSAEGWELVTVMDREGNGAGVCTTFWKRRLGKDQ